MQGDETEKLKNTGLFRDLSEKARGKIFSVFEKSRRAKDEIIFEEGSAGDSLYIIGSGEIIVEKKLDEKGEEFKQLAVLSEGDFFGEMAVIEERPRSARARARTDATLYRLSNSKFFDFIKSDSETGTKFLTQITKIVLRRLENTSNELTMLFDISKLITGRHKSTADFIAAGAAEILAYLEGEWGVKAYLYNRFNEEYEMVAEMGHPEGKGDFRPDIKRNKSGWLDESSYFALFSKEGKPLGCMVYFAAGRLGDFEKNALVTIFDTVSRIFSSAIINIEHNVELELMQKLKNQKNII